MTKQKLNDIYTMGMTGNLFRLKPTDLALVLKDSSLLEEMVYAEQNANDLLDLDKSWEAIFYLLTGYGVAEVDEAKPPFLWVLFSEQVVDEEQDFGYGPARFITADQVKQLDVALDGITPEMLRLKYDGKKLMDANIYPEVWDESDALDYVMEYFSELKGFYKKSAAEHKAVITFIS